MVGSVVSFAALARLEVLLLPEYGQYPVPPVGHSLSGTTVPATVCSWPFWITVKVSPDRVALILRTAPLSFVVAFIPTKRPPAHCSVSA